MTLNLLPAFVSSVLPFALAFGLSASSRAETGLEGTWATPLGKVRIERGESGFIGRLLDAAPICGWPKGAEVLRGRFTDRLFSGELRVCYPNSCRPEGWLFAMAARVEAEDGGLLVGAAAPPGAGCADAVYLGRPFRWTSAEEAAQGPVVVQAEPEVATIAAIVAESGYRRTMKPEAQKVYLEGMRLSSAGRYEAARQKLVAAQRLDPNSAEILTQIGVTWYARADYETAASLYRKAIAIDATFSKAHYNLACVLAKSGNRVGALRSLKAAVDSGFSSVSTLDTDSDLDSLRADPAYEEIRTLAERNVARGGR